MFPVILTPIVILTRGMQNMVGLSLSVAHAVNVSAYHYTQ